ncbi:hypothetical protein HZC09_01090 [Candidatus Micrarchaeota archaeon]|nr:hypothetical protein [Candidatus Micrarchaeota archaeon]
MEIPNPYKWKHYKYLIAVPLLLMLAALFFIPQVEKGIDLKGGLLITVQSGQNIDEDALKTEIAKVAGMEPDVRKFKSPAGSGVEIELPLRKEIDEATSTLARSRSLLEDWENAQVALSQGQGSEAAAASLEKQVMQEAGTAIQLTGGSMKAKDPNAAVSEADEAVSKARSVYREELLEAVQKVAKADSVSVREVGSSLSEFFFSKTREVILLAFILSSAIVFLIFRSVGPSLAVIFGALADIVITAGAMYFFGVPWSLPSVAALLMLVGFSLDTDLMLTIRVLKRQEDEPKKRAFDAMHTGFLMSCTNIVAFGVLTAVALILQIPTYYQIGVIATVGSVVDFIATWCGNAPLILWLEERRKK